ncbi:hypothetical protein D3C85_991660 [compost metagenome]
MRDDQHGHAFVGQLLHGAQHFAGQLRVQRGRGFIEQHDVGLHRQRAGNRHALFLAARQARGIVVALVQQANLAQQFFRLGDDLRLAHALDGDRRFNDVLQHRHVREQVERLEHHAHLAADAAHVAIAGVVAAAVVTGAGHHFTFDFDAAFIDGLKVIQATQERALARAGRANHRHHFALFERQRHLVQHAVRAERLGDGAGLDHDGSARRRTDDGGLVIGHIWHSAFPCAGRTTSGQAS